MKRTIRILTLLTVMMVTAGQAWADEPKYAIYRGTVTGGEIKFYGTLLENGYLDGIIDKATAGQTVYVRAIPEYGYTGIGAEFTAEETVNSGQAQAPRRTPGIGQSVTVTAVEGKPGLYQFTMPSSGNNVTVSATFKEKSPLTGVKYIDAEGNELITPEGTKVWVLDGSEKYLGNMNEYDSAPQFSTLRASRRNAPQSEYWYIVKNIKEGADAAYTEQLAVGGNTHLILGDGAEMKVTVENNNYAIETSYNNTDLTIYGQTGGTGTLNVKHTKEGGYAAIWSGNITINGGIVNVEGTGDGIYACNDIAINGGQVTAITTGNGKHGISSGNSNITLGWNKDTDFIKASSYAVDNGKAVKTAEGKPYLAYTPAATANDADKPFAYIAGGHTFTANELTAIAGKKLVPNPNGLTYMDWNDDQKKLVEKNTATDENTDNDIVYVLQGGGATTLPGGWYVAKDEVSYTGTLKFTSDTHLILADGAEMTVTNDDPDSRHAIYGYNANLTIYGQGSETEGTITATASEYLEYAIYSDNDNTASTITINGGKITAQSSYNGIEASSISYAATIIINGGQVTATGGDQGIYATSNSSTANIIINGGQVTATGGTEASDYGIYAANNIALGWTNADDFVMASSYSGSVKTAAGQRFIAYNMATEDDISANCIIGSSAAETTLTDTDLGNIAGKTLRPLAVEETANDGTKTTYPGYYVSDEAGLAFSGKTTPDFTIDDIPYYIYKANDDVTLTTDKDYGQNGIEFDATPADAIEDATDNPGTVVTTKEITMSAQDIAINDVKYYNTAVKYMDWDNEKKELVSKNTADDNTDDNNKVYILTGGGETTLPGGWYVVNNWNKDAEDGTDAYTSSLTLTGDTHLILADGAEMNVKGCDPYEYGGGSPITYKAAIYGKDYDLSIYGQGGKDSEGNSIEGKLIVRPSEVESNLDVACLYIKDIFINGGIIIVPVPFDKVGYENVVISGIKCNNSTIRGGHLEITPCDDDDDITASESIIILGGQTGTRRIHAGNDITLSLTNGSDYITASSYNVGTGSVKIPAGKALAYTDEDDETIILGGEADYIFGSGTNKTLYNIEGKTLRASKNFPIAAGQQYTALYQEQGDWKVTDPKIKMYVPTGRIIKNATTGAYEMGLQEVTGGGIPDGMPVIAGVESGTLPANIPVVGTSADEANDIEDAYDDAEENIEQAQGDTEPVLTLIATNTTETLAQQIINAASPKDEQGNITQPVNPSDYIIFSLVNGKLAATSANQTTVPSSAQPVIVVNKFDFLQMIRGTYNATTSSAPGIVIDLGDETMGINSLTPTLSEGEGAWYTLDGRRIANGQQPTAKGIYINKGKKVVIK